MDLLHRVEYWGERHHPRWMDIVRIALGIFLVYKGIDFLQNIGDLVTLMSIKTSFGDFSYIMIGHLIVFAHIMGGICIALGVLTRFACIMQIPILLGAVFLVNWQVAQPYSELVISLIVLLLLVYFLVAGNGPLSVNVDEPEKVRH
jgi:uncharacterized membrane protein YphA (DoxX/SURF4 family)